MTIVIGNLGLVLSLVSAIVAVIAGLAGKRFSSGGAVKWARVALLVSLAGFSVASVMLMGAMIDDEFRISYVSRFSERALPGGYKVAAFWAGQEGSLLLWAWLIAAMTGVHAVLTWGKRDAEHAVSTLTLGVISVFFAALMLFAANPFKLVEAGVVPSDGQGPNPMLQHPAMVAHPPILFAGYSGFAIPFAMMVGALWTGRKDNQWVFSIRRWVVLAWLMLSVGILLGAQWAYVELGWGGYWAWDPVENASLLPWLTGTALLHSIIVQQQRGGLKVWNAVLLALSFILCIFGTYITRSGVVESVHSFGKSLIGSFFLVFLASSVLFSVFLTVTRLRLLKADRPLETIWGRDGMFMLGNVILLAMTVVTAVGTLFPVISEAITGSQVSVGQKFYNMAVVPMGVVLMAMMAIGPLLSVSGKPAEDLKKRVGMPLVGGVVVAILSAVGFNAVNPWAIVTSMIVGTAVVAMSWDLMVTINRRARTSGMNLVAATIYTLDGSHRRYGGQTVHVGMLMIMVGIAGSSIYSQKHDVELVTGETVREFAPGWRIKVEDMNEVRAGNYEAIEATVTLRDPSGTEMTLKPERRFYRKSEEQPLTQVANWSNLQRDAYVTLAGWANQGKNVAIEVIINPLVIWLWIGGVVMTLGGVWCLVPRLLPAPVAKVAPTGVSEVAHTA